MNKEQTDLYYDCLELFGITEEDLVPIGRTLRQNAKIDEIQDEPRIDYEQYLSKHFDLKSW